MSARLKTIVDAMRLQPGHLVLEIGCGHGVAGSYICDRLQSGRYLGIDRSSKMIGAAARRNAKFVSTGKAHFQVADFTAFDPGNVKFDRILAVRVRLFHTDPRQARSIVRHWLAPAGKLVVDYDEA